MPKRAMTNKQSSQKPRKPATSPEMREQQMVSLAVDLAEQQLRDGTASSQVITHYLKLGSSKERTEQKKLEMEIELSKAKIENLKSAAASEEMYTKAIEAMRKYSNFGGDEIG